MLLMLLFTAGGGAVSKNAGDDGLVVGLFASWFSFAGVVLHGARYLGARASKNSIERTYLRRFGQPSSKNAALGQEVHEQKPRLLLALTLSTDWDLVIQGLIGLALTLLTR
jgi:hypothetical protein